MKIPVLKLGRDSLDRIFSRSQINDEKALAIVKDIIRDVKQNGDEALFRYTLKFDGLALDKSCVMVTEREIEEAYSKVDKELLSSMKKAKENVLEYHKRQLIPSDTSKNAGWLMRPINRAGLYVPGGTAPYPSSVIMCVMPAVAAGVPEIIMATPNPRNPLTLVAANECGVKKIYKAGGAQAIAAMAFGTESIEKADVIVGPGNIYVTLAKKEIFGHAAIDMTAGPSEILIIADDTADADYVAADLLSQAEHDKMSACILVTTSERLMKAVADKLPERLNKLPRREIAGASIESNGAIILTNTIEEAVELSNKIAPEHLEIMAAEPEKLLAKIRNAGAVFLGQYAPEPLGDYIAGPSHVLPTSGTSRYFSVLNTLTFMKRISVINYSKTQFDAVSADIVRLAESENFEAHAQSIKVRMK